MTIHKTILTEAAKLVDGERQAHYGHPADNHGCTAEMWTSYLERRGLLAEEAELDARDVCMLNILQKVSRDANTRKPDNLIDIAGFARNAEMVGVDEGRDESFASPVAATGPTAILATAIADFGMSRNRRPSEIHHHEDSFTHIRRLFGIPLFYDYFIRPGVAYLIDPRPGYAGVKVVVGVNRS